MKKVKLSDVIVRANTKVDKDNTDLLYYVGGEHFESGNLMVEQKGLIAGSTIGPMFYYGFKAGQFLLVSRNPHLRKAGIVDFDGICSEKTFVLQTADESVLLQSYLPFILQNDRFWEYAISNKHGSTNFFINWSTLANYEFFLPSIEEQQRISTLAWAAYSLKSKYKRLLSATDDLVKSQFIEMFGDIQDYEYTSLSNVCKIITDGTHQPPKFVDNGIPFLLVSNIAGDTITYETSKHITKETYDTLIKRTPIEVGDILLSTVGSYGHPAIVKDTRPFCFQRHIAYLKPDPEQVDSTYLHTAILSTNVQSQIELSVLGVAQKTLNLSSIRKLRIPLPPMAQQIAFKEFMLQTEKSKFELKQSIENIDNLIKSLIQQDNL